MDTYRYEVSPGALLHLRVTLQKLSRTGRQRGHSCLDLGMGNGSWACGVQVRPEGPAPGKALCMGVWTLVTNSGLSVCRNYTDPCDSE